VNNQYEATYPITACLQFFVIEIWLMHWKNATLSSTIWISACGGELACATCHLIFEQSLYDKLPEKLEEEDDMLDLAIDLQPTSRLGCQIRVTKDLAGCRVRLPQEDI